MSTEFKVGEFVACTSGRGFVIRGGKKETSSSRFNEGSVGQVQDIGEDDLIVYVIGEDKNYAIPKDEVMFVDVFKTGKGYQKMICNICHALQNMEAFEINQTDASGSKTRRPSCRKCRRHIDHKPMSSKEKREANKHRPPKGTIFSCPICKKRGIVGVNVKVVLDHRHSTGTARAFLCDSCNTGLGRFKNGENYLKNALDYLASFEDAE